MHCIRTPNFMASLPPIGLSSSDQPNKYPPLVSVINFKICMSKLCSGSWIRIPTFSNKYINIRTCVATCIPYGEFYLRGPNLLIL